MNTSFLSQVAQYFHQKGNIHDYCFVLPNHRSCKFFERELDISSKKVFMMPEMMPINDFITRLSGSIAVNAIDAMFILYKCYTSMPGNEEQKFDKFVFWGNILLNDFNDVDMYLVDPKEIFTNIKEHREIQSNYIDEDLQQLVAQYFNLGSQGLMGEDVDFWRNYSNENLDKEEVRASYLKLWQNMLGLYEKYNAELDMRGVKSPGRIYREAVTAVKEGRDLGHKCYVFVGFNMLSTSEIAIMKRLGDQKKAMYFWDTSSPAFSDKYPQNPGGRYVKFFQQQFPSPHDFTAQPIATFPELTVMGVPSNVGQAKCAFNLIEKMVDNKHISNPLNAIDTAIVLPDESLFMPLLNSLSPKVPNINVTMGYPLQNSDIASLMRVVSRMHRRARRDADDKWSFYRNDVKIILSHPIIKSCYGDHALAIIEQIDADNVFEVPEEMFKGRPFEGLFHTAPDTNDPASVTEFLSGLVHFCNSVLKIMSPQSTKEEIDEDIQRPMTLQEAFIKQYIDILNRVRAAINEHSVPPCENTVFFLVDKLVGVHTMPLEGEPLHGLQIMGMLETRCLDFDNIIILSCNEHILPRKFRSSSFITDFMRRGYGMSTVADQDMMWTYNFYRLISRAKRVYMLYDTSEQAVGSNEVTRFVHQLKMIYGCPINEINLSMPVPVSEQLIINVPKERHVADAVNSYRPEIGNKCLSASSINEFINCRLAFYFRHIEGLNADSTEDDFMDFSTFGTIVHDTLQELYYPDVDGKPRTGEYKVTGAMITEFKNKHLNHVICRIVNREYSNKTKPNTPLSGESSIVSVAIEMYVKSALDHDLSLLAGGNDYFTVLECEHKHKNIPLNFGDEKFNFTYTADRIDRMSNGTLRMVDYKTGHDETTFATMDDLFTREDKRRKAVLQLMLYCNAYAQENNYDGPIKPEIYSLQDMSKAGIFRIVDKKSQPLLDYHDINEEFKQRMEEVLKEFFDLNEPFKQTTNTKPSTSPCRYCKFVDFCRRL